MRKLWKKIAFTALGIFASAALGWMVIFPYLILPRLGRFEHSLYEMALWMLVGFVFVFAILGATIRSFGEFWKMSAASGVIFQVSETIVAIVFPFSNPAPLTSPLFHWTIGLLLAVLFCAFFISIGLVFGWLIRRFQQTDPE